MDSTDRKILAELQKDGRLSITELADRVRLSISPCHRRLRALEHSGAIVGYHAQLDAHSLGLTFEALIFVTMHTANRATLEAFEQAVIEIPHVLQAQRLFGDPDYLLRVLTRDLPAFQALYDEQIATLPGVQRVSSHPRHEKRRQRQATAPVTSCRCHHLYSNPPERQKDPRPARPRVPFVTLGC